MKIIFINIALNWVYKLYLDYIENTIKYITT